MPLPRSSRILTPPALLLLGILAACDSTPPPPVIPNTTPELEAAELSGALRLPVRLAGMPDEPLPLRERLRHHAVPGVAIAVVDGGELRWAEGYGVLTAGSEDPVTPDTRFQVGSLSKPLAATLALRAVAADRLDLDVEIDAVLRAAGAAYELPRGGFAGAVTPRRLLSHTAGVGQPSVSGYSAGEPLPNLEQSLGGSAPANHPAIAVERAPGSGWAYSGGGYEVLRRVLVALDGPFDAAMRREIFEPLEMLASGFGAEPPAGGPVARGHGVTSSEDSEARRAIQIDDGWRRHPEYAAAGLWSTAPDLTAWLVDLQKSHAGKPGRRLPRDLTRTMLEPQTDANGWGLGLELRGRGHSRYFVHRGATAGYRALVVGFIHSGHGAVVLTNGDGGDALAREIIAALAEQYAWPALQPQVRSTVDVDDATLDALVGSYRGLELPSLTLTVERTDDGLTARTWSGATRLYAASSTSFFDLEQGLSLDIDTADRDDPDGDDLDGNSQAPVRLTLRSLHGMTLTFGLETDTDSDPIADSATHRGTS
ncbi:MAG: serine hydrolase domain-containing protein [Acidobacteriota bacterium]